VSGKVRNFFSPYILGIGGYQKFVYLSSVYFHREAIVHLAKRLERSGNTAAKQSLDCEAIVNLAERLERSGNTAAKQPRTLIMPQQYQKLGWEFLFQPLRWVLRVLSISCWRLFLPVPFWLKLALLVCA